MLSIQLKQVHILHEKSLEKSVVKSYKRAGNIVLVAAKNSDNKYIFYHLI